MSYVATKDLEDYLILYYTSREEAVRAYVVWYSVDREAPADPKLVWEAEHAVFPSREKPGLFGIRYRR